MQALVQGSNQLGLAAFRTLSAADNLCLAPLSLQAGVMLTRAALDEPPALKKDMPSGEVLQLHYELLMTNLPKHVTMANAVFVRGPMTSPGRLDDGHAAEVIPVDFRDAATSATVVNQWAARGTRGAITHVADTFPPDTMIYTANAVSVRPKWRYRFDRIHTCLGHFHVDQDTTVQTIFMSQENTLPFLTDEHADCDFLELPCDDGTTSMVIGLPHQKDGLAKLEELVSTAFLKSVLNRLYMKIEVSIVIPRFTSACTMDLSHFVYPDPKVKLVQTTFIAVTEQGEENAVKSHFLFGGAVRTTRFAADHPFLYVMIHKPTKSILFIGTFKQPKPCDERDLPKSNPPDNTVGFFGRSDRSVTDLRDQTRDGGKRSAIFNRDFPNQAKEGRGGCIMDTHNFKWQPIY